mgnify:CR=1 FL=1
MTGALRLGRAALLARYGFAPLAFGLGALLSLALAPLHMLWAVPFALGGAAALLLAAADPRRAARIGWLFGTGYFLFGLSWVLEPFQVDAERHAWMAPFALLFLAGGLALFWAAAFWLAARLARGGWRLLALLAAWSLAELARAYVFTGFPWAAFGQFWIDTPAAQLLPWTGPHGLAVLTLAATLPLALLPRRPVLALAPPAAAAALLLALPQPPQAALTATTVRVVQPNAPQHQKWHPDFAWGFVRRQLEFSAAAPRPDLIVWPETSVPAFLETEGGLLATIAETAAGAQVVMGIQRRETGRYYNSLIALDGAGAVSARYDKAHLVPFGEYVPFASFWARFGIFGLAAQAGSGYTPGPGAELVRLTAGAALPLICYEAVFPQDVNAAPERPGFLLQITNDAWFGTYSGPYQHLVQARMRAAEQGLPMVRAANTGVSAMIDPHGRLLAGIPLGEAGYTDARLPAPLPPTLYSRSGDWPVLLLALSLLAFCALAPRRLAIRS